MRISIAGLFLLVSLALSCRGIPGQPKEPTRPNILLIVLDDLGYSDLGCYGSEIATPNIDAIAARGLRFSGFRTAPMCGPSRAMLISGNDNHMEGMGRMMSHSPAVARYKELPYYEEEISDRVVAFPRLLQQAGYHTCAVGKWHLGWEASSNPINQGFSRSCVLLNSFANYYHTKNYGLSHAHGLDTVSYYTQDGNAIEYPTGTYATEWFTDKMLGFIQEAGDKPFFAYLPYTAPHWPLQIPEDWKDRYKGQYNQGYQDLMQRRLKGLKAQGIVGKQVSLPPYNDVPAWSSLSQKERQLEARKMEIMAAMIAHVDAQIGRIVAYLQQTGKLDNTLLWIISDNGAGAENFSQYPAMAATVNDTVANSLENLGTPNSFATLGSHWAQACCVPYRKHKSTMYEGGLAAPCLVAGPGVAPSGEVKHAFLTIQDVAPSLLEIARVPYPETWNNKPVAAPVGRSIWSYVQGKTPHVHPPEFVFAQEHRDAASLRMGDWKMVNQRNAADTSFFELYNLAADPSEQTDVANQHPAIKTTLLSHWEQFKAKNGVVFLGKLNH